MAIAPVPEALHFTVELRTSKSLQYSSKTYLYPTNIFKGKLQSGVRVETKPQNPSTDNLI